MGNNLGGNFPVVDRFENGVVTSIKSIDLGAKSYRSPGAVLQALIGCVDQVANFQGGRWGEVSIKASDIAERRLDVVVPSVGSRTQEEEMFQAVQYAQSRGVHINLFTVH
jgi:filamentous hemagglutinin